MPNASRTRRIDRVTRAVIVLHRLLIRSRRRTKAQNVHERQSVQTKHSRTTNLEISVHHQPNAIQHHRVDTLDTRRMTAAATIMSLPAVMVAVDTIVNSRRQKMGRVETSNTIRRNQSHGQRATARTVRLTSGISIAETNTATAEEARTGPANRPADATRALVGLVRFSLTSVA